MKLIDDFAEKVLNENGFFKIIIKEISGMKKNYYFVQGNFGKARYIYGTYSYRDDVFYSDLKMEVVAIISDKTIYIVNKFFFDLYMDDVELPKNIKFFDSALQEKNAYIKDIVFPEFYKKLDTTEAKKDVDVAWCKEKARNYLLSLNPQKIDFQIDKIFDERDLVNILCGFSDVEKEAYTKLEAKKEWYIKKKAENEMILELIHSKRVVEDWELKIADGLKSVDAKTVTIYFQLNGNVSSAKITPMQIIRVLINNDNFSSYDFATCSQGENLIKTLGAGNSPYSDKPLLTCKQINKITYGRKELYNKENNF